MTRAGAKASRPFWRRPRLVFAALVLGTLTTVATAWGACLWARPVSAGTWVASANWSERRCTCHIRGTTGFDQIFVTSSIGTPRGYSRMMFQAVDDIRDVRLPRGATWDLFNLSLPDQEIMRAGWPLRCLESEGRYSSEFVFAPERERALRSWALRVRPVYYLGFDYGLLGTIPLRPVPLPFLANTALFATAWWILLLIPTLTPAAIRARRRVRGLCPRCSYDLRHDHATGCPECGWNRQPSPPQPAPTTR